MSTVRNTIIIGSGPAGLTAAIYTARASLAPLVIEGTEVENFPGFPEGIMGPELMMNFRSQAERFGAEFITEKVTKVDFSSRPFKVWIRDTEYSANSIIVATGAQSLMLDLPRETELIGHGVSTCATCDGFFFRGHEIA
ncbi:MAG: thioredoxin reductase, partial [Actinomycetota bacterium]